MINLENWSQLLNTVASHDTASHSRLCWVTDNGQRIVKALSQEEYSSSIGSRNERIKKLSLREIVRISDQVISKFSDELISKSVRPNVFLQEVRGLKKHLVLPCLIAAQFFQFVDSVDKTPAPPAPPEMADISKSIARLEMTNKILKQMSERATQKHIQEKTQGIWSTIKYYIWSCFFDQSSKITDLNFNTNVNWGRREFIFDEALDRVAKRIILNMKAYKDKIEKMGFQRAKFEIDQSNGKLKESAEEWLKLYPLNQSESLTRSVEERSDLEMHITIIKDLYPLEEEINKMRLSLNEDMG
jgi:hypothetical protein